MILLPSAYIVIWLLGLLALAIFSLGAWLVWRALRPRKVIDVDRRGSRRPEVEVRHRPEIRRWPLFLGLALLLCSLAGSSLVGLAFPSGDRGPGNDQSAEVQKIKRPDGTQIYVRSFGRSDAPTLVLTHGWSLDSDEWGYARQQLGNQFRLITWDLRGLGQSTAPANKDYALERMAEDLDAVVQTAGTSRVVLVGHSIGGMIDLTYCKLFPERLNSRVAGIVQFNTTYTDPAKTTKNAQTQVRLHNTIGEQLMYTTAALSPILRLSNWFAYRSGILQMYVASSSFAGTETRSQVEYAAGTFAKSSPAVVALGTLAMLHWDASDVLARINVPTLIITADQDTTTLPSASEHMKQAIPNAQLKMISPAAHLGVLERNSEYNRALADFATAQLQR